jgi:valyl-tRNA synthetase
MVSPMPKAEAVDEALLARFTLLQEAVSAIRNIRKQKNIPQKEAIELKVVLDENYPRECEAVLVKMGNLSAITPVTEKNATDAGFIVKTTQYFIPMGDNVNIEEEIAKLEKDLAYYEGFLTSVMKKLSNERFVSSAPAQVVANERAKQADAEAKIAALKEQLAALR